MHKHTQLNNFTAECSYCYKNIKTETISLCSCGYSFCNDHITLHTNKTGCKIILNICNKTVNIFDLEATSAYFSFLLLCEEGCTDRNLLNELFLEFVDAKLNSPDDSVYCKHLKIKQKEFYKPTKCNSCTCDENLYACLDCDYIGCGRIQYGSKGQGHMLEHYKETKHAQVVKINDTKYVYCYECNTPINNQITIEIKETDAFMGLLKLTAEEKKAINKCSNGEDELDRFISQTPFEKYHEKIDESEIVTETDLIGIKNENNTCFIASALQLLSNAIEKDLTVHFELCESNPTECFLCQFIKIITALKNNKTPKIIRINLFIELFYKDYGYIFTKGAQADACEFIQIILEKISFYEECCLVENITETFKYEIAAKLKCDKCLMESNYKDTGTIYMAKFNNDINKAITLNLDVECSKCSEIMKVTDKNTAMPDNLIIAIKRAKIVDNSPIKILEDVNVSDYITILDNKYKLICVIIHKGISLNTGHYIFYKDEYIINDTVVRRKKESDLGQSYILYYRRNK